MRIHRWSWAGAANNVKSYPNVVVTAAAKQLSAISSITSAWAWTYDGKDVVADVAYDLFTSSTAAGDEEFEIMIWLAAIGGAGPISSTYVRSSRSHGPVRGTDIFVLRGRMKSQQPSPK